MTAIALEQTTNPKIMYLLKEGEFYRKKDLLVKIGGNCYIITRPYIRKGIEVIDATPQGCRRSQPMPHSSLVDWYNKVTGNKVKEVTAVDINTAYITRLV